MSLRVALDDFDITNLFSLKTYDSLQIFHLCHLSLFECVESLAQDEVGKRVHYLLNLKKDLRWSDGSSLTPKEMIEALFKMCTTSNFYRYFHLRHLKTLTLQDFRIVMEFEKPFLLLPEFLKTPLLSPRKNRLCSRYSPTTIDSSRLTFQLNDGLPGEHSVEVMRLKDPVDNITALQSNKIHITCDTAFPHEGILQIQGKKNINNTGLFFAINYGQSLWKDGYARKHIQSCLEKTSLPGVFGSYQRASRGFCHINFSSQIFENFQIKQSVRSISNSLQNQKRAHKLTLLYDNHYPNKIIAEACQVELEQSGYTVELKTKNFYEQAPEYDLKLDILCSHFNHPLARYGNVFDLPYIKQNPSVAQEYAKAYLCLLGSQQQGWHDLFRKLESLISQHAICVPLTMIPSIYMAVEDGLQNPLMNNISVDEFIC